MRRERAARALVLVAVLGAPLGVWLSGGAPDAVEIRGTAPGVSGGGEGGWSTELLRAEVGEPLRLRLTSDDVVHGFALGRTGSPAVEVEPGRFTEVTLRFDEPGIYTYYCNRWCGPGHWWMRGTIEVRRDGELDVDFDEAPTYERLGVNLDAPHDVEVELEAPPSARRGAELVVDLPDRLRVRQPSVTQSPYGAWRQLRADPASGDWSDEAVWDVVAARWRSRATDEQRRRGRSLYVDYCAACHGREGRGDGVFAERLEHDPMMPEEYRRQPAAFTEFAAMAGASEALLDGKVRRGGMGTAMPAYATILSDEEIEALVAYLWSFPFLE